MGGGVGKIRRRTAEMEEEEREQERERVRVRRADMDEEEREEERERLRRRRAEMDEEEREQERERVRRRRASQSPESAILTRRSERVRQQQRRASTPATESGRIYVGPITTVCEYCQALRFPNEPQNCCHNGKVSLPTLADYPTPLKELLTGSSTEARNLRENIRKYNSAYSFASFGAQTVQVSGSA